MEYDLFGDVLKPSKPPVELVKPVEQVKPVSGAAAKPVDPLISVRSISCIVKDGLVTTVWNA
jgi:hypothetical protein